MEVQVENKNETTVHEVVKNDAKGRKAADVVVVTQDNFDAYANEKLGIANPDPEAEAKEAKAKLESEKKAKEEAKRSESEDVEGEEGVAEHLPKDKKGRLNERFSELTKARKEAEERAAKRESELKTEREAREAAETLANELKAKYEPVKTDPDPEPQIGQFQDVNEYAKALKEWQADQTRREDAAKAEQDAAQREAQRVAREFTERQNKFKTETEDYEKTLAESAVKVSDQVRDAILESEVAPQILYHFAKNPDEATRIGKLTIAKALTEVGRLETKFIKSDGGEKQETKAAPKTSVAEISRAPAPISPIRGATAPVVNLSGTDEVPKSMTYDQWKALRKAGKIR